ncbi:Hypothetical predicted protein, partial [Paramuricea clavata]
FWKYESEQFADDIAHIPWDAVQLMDSVDDKLNAFNDFFLTCLDSHAPVKTIIKLNPFITEDIRKLIATWKNVHKKARISRLKEDWF